MMTSARQLTRVAAALSMLLPAALSAQTLVTSFGSAPGPTTTLPIPTSNYTLHSTYTFSDGTQFASTVNNSVIGSAGYGLCHNGGWNRPQVGLNTGSGSMRFMFTGPVSWVAAFMNYAPCTGQDAYIQALDANNNVLSFFNLTQGSPISTPSGQNAGEVRGIARANADIYGFELGNAFVTVGELQYAAVVVTPEPASLVLLSTGLLGVLGFARRRRKV